MIELMGSLFNTGASFFDDSHYSRASIFDVIALCTVKQVVLSGVIT